MLLNYGHTVGHALESASGYGALLHGEAVAVGMRAAAIIARELDVLDAESAQRQEDVLSRLDLPATWPHVACDDVLGRLVLDKKRAGSAQRWILAERVGLARISSDVPIETVRRAVLAVTGTAATASL